jgi:acetoin utilization deacetylase AcuC-like enzyme
VVTSAGFCIVNNVAIGAAYLKNTYRDQIKKIAIVDFDVHHGNGTEEIVQMLKGKPFKHSIQTEKMGTFINKQNKRLNWLDFDDPKNVLFVSTHLYFEDDPKVFYPYTGGLDNNTLKEDKIYPGGILNIPFGPKNNNPGDYKAIFKAKLIPRLHKFKPDLIMISAGFDGHEYEYINKGKMKLNEFDFAYITQQIQFLANKYCNGRVVSVLEGGYNVSTGLVSSFAQSAFFHARFLNLSINMFHCYDVNLTGMKRKYDIQDDQESIDKLNKSKIKAKKSDKKNDGIDDDED